jgi:hypothetical protein
MPNFLEKSIDIIFKPNYAFISGQTLFQKFSIKFVLDVKNEVKFVKTLFSTEIIFPFKNHFVGSLLEYSFGRNANCERGPDLRHAF